jgi:hypothetical protein
MPRGCQRPRGSGEAGGVGAALEICVPRWRWQETGLTVPTQQIVHAPTDRALRVAMLALLVAGPAALQPEKCPPTAGPVGRHERVERFRDGARARRALGPPKSSVRSRCRPDDER